MEAGTGDPGGTWKNGLTVQGKDQESQSPAGVEEGLQQQKEGYEKCVPTAEQGRGPSDKTQGKSHSTQCLPHLGLYWQDLPSVMPGP